MAADKGNGTVTLLAGGDIGPIVEPADALAELITPVLRQADLRFGQCERVYSQRGWSPQWILGPSGEHCRLHPRLASVWKAAGIDVVSLASNHAMEWGPEPVLDTIDLFRSWGMVVIGAGKNSEEARRPGIVECNGVKIAFLAYCSLLRDGHAAAPDKAGVAPMRAHTYYEAEYWQPGSPPRIITAPFEEDLAALQEDIRKVRQTADVVVVSIHWGVHMLPKLICDYQPIVGHAAIDAGADLILGHHPHVLRAVEVYKGKFCFYCIGNFMTTGSLQPRMSYEDQLYSYRIASESMPPRGKYPFPMDSQKSMLAKVVFSKRGVERVSFLPVFINGQAQPAALSRQDPRFYEVLEYAEWVSEGYPHNFTLDGDEVVVDTSA